MQKVHYDTYVCCLSSIISFHAHIPIAIVGANHSNRSSLMIMDMSYCVAMQ